jgi:glycosyltransferase involved in cell wall biosynthesis
MKRIIMIDFTTNITYEDIGYKPIGGSEFQFYNLAFNISTFENIICYNKIEKEHNCGNILYKNLTELYNDKFTSNDIIIIQRLFPEMNIIQLFENCIIYIWIHDYDFNAVFFQFQKIENNDDKVRILNLININNNINFVFNSEFTKKFFNIHFSLNKMIVDETRQNIIYNILYEKYICKKGTKDNKNTNKNLVYASGWNKGVQKIIEIFEYILTQDSSFKLILMSPGYEYNKYKMYELYLKNKYPNNIIIYGPVNKTLYCELIQNSGCVLAPSFPETFGCVFSEAYYLGTPVICDVKSGAVKEIIGKDNVVNYKNFNEVYNKIITKIESNEKIELDEKFMLNYNLTIWKKLLLLPITTIFN